MAYATPADLASFMQVPSVDTASANLFLQGATDAIEAEIGQSLGQQDVVDLLLDGPSGSAVLILPGFPVTAVTSIAVLLRDGTWQTLTEGADYTWSTDGIVTRVFATTDPQGPIAPAWPSRPQSIRTSYSRGEGAVPSAGKTVCLMVAARMMANPTGIQAERIGNMDLRFGAKGGTLELSPAELRMLGRLTDHVIA
jgi:hypothetical protein